MNYLHRLLLVLASAGFFIVSAQAQNGGTVTNHAVPVGKGPGVTGFTSAAPGPTGVPLTSNGASSDPSFHAVTNAGVAPGAANTTKGSLDGATTSDIAIASCSAIYQFTQWVSGSGWQCGIIPVFPSRASAATFNLSAFSAIQTLGYASPGDGGNSYFFKSASAFVDTAIATGTISGNGGSTCTNGTYFGVQFSGGTGTLFEATLTVAGNVVTAVVQTGVSPGYTVGDVLTAAVGTSPGGVAGCASPVTYTVSTLTTPTGSFSDTAANKWQVIMPATGVDMRAFGVKFDYTQAGGDAGATDNFTTISNVYNFAAAQIGGIFARGGSQGGTVLIPRGSAMYCGSNGAKALQQPYGVTVRGQGDFSSVLKPCDAWGVATNMYELCNSQSHLACFQTMFEQAQIFVSINQDTSANVSTLAVVYTNNCQQENCGLRNAQVFSGACRIAYKIEIGYGGASMIPAADNVSLTGGKSNANCNGNASAQMSVNLGTTQVTIDKLTLSALSASFGGPKVNGLAVTGGFVEIHALTAENFTTPLIVNIPTSLANGMVWVQGFQADQGCGWFATLPNGNTLGNFAVAGPMAVNSCTSGLVFDGQPGGSNMTTPQVLPKNFNP